MRIPPHNQPDLLRSAPSLKLLFTRRRPMHVIVRLPVQQALDVVLVCESLDVMILVRKDSLVQVSAESDVERAGETGQNVHTVIATVARHAAMLNGFALERSVGGHNPTSLFPSRELAGR